MGYDLSNSAGGYVRFTGSGWDLALAMARHYGWVPAGVPKPATWDEKENGSWEEGYWANAGQQVTAGDAAMLAAALERAVAAPDFVDVVVRIKEELDEAVGGDDPQWRSDPEPTPRERAEGFRRRLVELADLARQGPFMIE
jgi:hypothetical protein